VVRVWECFNSSLLDMNQGMSLIVCTLYSTSVPCTQHLYLVLNICTLYSTSVHGTQHLHLVLNICTFYSTSAPCTQHLYMVLNICTLYSTPVPCTQHLHLVLNICTWYSTSAPCTQHLHLVLNICTWYSIWCRLTNCNKLPLFATNLFREIYLEESINWCVFLGWKALDILPDYEINKTRKLNFLYLVHVFTPN